MKLPPSLVARAALATLLIGAVPVQVRAQDASASQKRKLPVDLAHIQREASRQPIVRLDQEKLRFYVLIVAKQPNFEDFVGDYDLRYGPTRGGAAMTHQEFLDMVTPNELRELFGGTSANSFALFQAAAMNAAGQFLIKRAVEQIRGARDEREVQAIRQRITRELEALEGRRP
jgi:hypothetical protein